MTIDDLWTRQKLEHSKLPGWCHVKRCLNKAIKLTDTSDEPCTTSQDKSRDSRYRSTVKNIYFGPEEGDPFRFDESGYLYLWRRHQNYDGYLLVMNLIDGKISVSLTPKFEYTTLLRIMEVSLHLWASNKGKELNDPIISGMQDCISFNFQR